MKLFIWLYVKKNDAINTILSLSYELSTLGEFFFQF